jgi:hypothetical protein
MGLHVVLVLESHGFTEGVYGPFKCADDATEWGRANCVEGQWDIEPLRPIH